MRLGSVMKHGIDAPQGRRGSDRLPLHPSGDVLVVLVDGAGIDRLSFSQVSPAARRLDDELEARRSQPLGEGRYLILEARYEKMRHSGVVRDAAALSAIAIGPDERRRVMGVSVPLSEAEVHGRAFLDSLQARGLRGVEYVVSDDHAGRALR